MALEALRDVILQKSGEWAAQVQRARDRDEQRAYEEKRRQAINSDAMAMFRQQAQIRNDSEIALRRAQAEVDRELSLAKTDADWAQKAIDVGLTYDPKGDVNAQRRAIENALLQRKLQTDETVSRAAMEAELRNKIGTQGLRNELAAPTVANAQATLQQSKQAIDALQKEFETEKEKLIAASALKLQQLDSQIAVMDPLAQGEAIKSRDVMVRSEQAALESRLQRLQVNFSDRARLHRETYDMAAKQLLQLGSPLVPPVLQGLDAANASGNVDTAVVPGDGASMFTPPVQSAIPAPVADTGAVTAEPRMHRGRRTYFGPGVSPVEEGSSPGWTWGSDMKSAQQRGDAIRSWISNAPANALETLRRVPADTLGNFSSRTYDPTGLTRWFGPSPRQ